MSFVHDNDTLQIGAARLTTLHTPGHTLESACYLINDEALITGDTLFLTAVGRPDLHADFKETTRRARFLYRSLQRLQTFGALRGGHADEVDRALRQYRRQHHAALAGRHARDVDFAQARPFNMFERLMYSAATRDSSLGQYTGPHTTRLANFRQFPPLKAVVRALWVNLTHRDQTRQPAPQPSPA